MDVAYSVSELVWRTCCERSLQIVYLVTVGLFSNQTCEGYSRETTIPFQGVTRHFRPTRIVNGIKGGHGKRDLSLISLRIVDYKICWG
jgi:hypothetical protein